MNLQCQPLVPKTCDVCHQNRWQHRRRVQHTAHCRRGIAVQLGAPIKPWAPCPATDQISKAAVQISKAAVWWVSGCLATQLLAGLPLTCQSDGASRGAHQSAQGNGAPRTWPATRVKGSGSVPRAWMVQCPCGRWRACQFGTLHITMLQRPWQIITTSRCMK